MAQSLEDQLAEVFARGLDSDPELRASLEEALSSSLVNEKATKAEANYRKAQNDASERCETCSHFNAPNGCDVVSGLVSSDGLSDYYEPIDKEEDASE